MNCSFKGCVKKAHSKGLCSAHYQQQRQGKELKPLQQQFHGLTEKERLMAWVAKQPNGCWKWLGSIKKAQPKGRKVIHWHGQWRNVAGQIELTHRAAWRILVGPIPRSAQVLHRCDNPLCVNPEHLFLGTPADNVSDMWDKGRARPGVSLGEKHGMSKLTSEVVKEIRESKERGTEIAARLGISTTTIYDVRNRRIWKHVD